MNILDLENYSIYGTGDSDRHLLTLYSIALSSKSKFNIELGVRSGQTTKPLFLASKNNNGKLYSVDKNNVDLKLDPTYWTFFKGDSIEFLLYLEERIIKKDEPVPGIIYIDDWHSYSHVKKELEIIDRICSPSTIILLHDLMYGETCPYYHTDLTLKEGQWADGGPYRAVSELNPQFWEFSTLPYNNGLTILRKKYSSKYAR